MYVMSWYLWEDLTHIMTMLLYVYIFYLMYKRKGSNTVTEYLLLLIALSLGVIIHQNINNREKHHKYIF